MLNPFLNTVGVIQIPHHGSKHNFKKDNLKVCNEAVYVISAGYKYWHPNKEVLMDLIAERSPYAIADNLCSSKVVFNIHPK